jgi:hypothetical protein
MGRTAGTQSNINLSANRLNELFGKYPDVEIPVSVGFLRDAKKFFKFELPELPDKAETETAETPAATTTGAKRTGPQVEA